MTMADMTTSKNEVASFFYDKYLSFPGRNFTMLKS